MMNMFTWLLVSLNRAMTKRLRFIMNKSSNLPIVLSIRRMTTCWQPFELGWFPVYKLRLHEWSKTPYLSIIWGVQVCIDFQWNTQKHLKIHWVVLTFSNHSKGVEPRFLVCHAHMHGLMHDGRLRACPSYLLKLLYGCKVMNILKWLCAIRFRVSVFGGCIKGPSPSLIL
jgi:hypothetical protein